LDVARLLAAKKRQAASGRALGQFAGAIANEDRALFTEAIDEGCERVNLDE